MRIKNCSQCVGPATSQNNRNSKFPKCRTEVYAKLPRQSSYGSRMSPYPLASRGAECVDVSSLQPEHQMSCSGQSGLRTVNCKCFNLGFHGLIPSIMSMCSQSAPQLIASMHSCPRAPKSADRMDGAIMAEGVILQGVSIV